MVRKKVGVDLEVEMQAIPSNSTLAAHAAAGMGFWVDQCFSAGREASQEKHPGSLRLRARTVPKRSPRGSSWSNPPGWDGRPQSPAPVSILSHEF